jgi:uncharacterized protein DUF4232
MRFAPLLLLLAVAGCGFTNSSSETKTVTVVHTVTHAATTTATPAPPPTAAAGECAAADLSGTFAELQGSAGAGNIVYTLRLTNTSKTDCFVSGLPQVLLVDANGKALPTSPSAESPGTQTAVKTTLHPGDTATSQARFSPDVNGVGEGGGPCEPVATTLRVTAPGGGTLDVKIDPPTRVCSHGGMTLSNLTTAA